MFFDCTQMANLCTKFGFYDIERTIVVDTVPYGPQIQGRGDLMATLSPWREGERKTVHAAVGAIF